MLGFLKINVLNRSLQIMCFRSIHPSVTSNICTTADSFRIKTNKQKNPTNQTKSKTHVTSINHRFNFQRLMQVYCKNTLLDQVRFHLTLYFNFQSERSNVVEEISQMLQGDPCREPTFIPTSGNHLYAHGFNAVLEMILEHQDG